MSKTQTSTIEAEANNKTLLGFWIYLMTDCVLFGSLFATYAVLHNNTFGGPSGAELFSLPLVLTETIILLASSLTSGLGVLAARMAKPRQALIWLGLTFILGASFLGIELTEFAVLLGEGHSWSTSAFLTSFFTLVGTHGLHILVGLIWLAVILYRLVTTDLNAAKLQQLVMFSMFWHFLDVVWIFIFSIVYLFGSLGL